MRLLIATIILGWVAAVTFFGPELAREARELFPDTVVPRDFDSIEVPFAERGAPQLVKGGARAVSSGGDGGIGDGAGRPGG